jgi:hypothetical protein
MTPRCTDLDPFFDGELESHQAAAFRDHLVTCDRCQLVLHGRMQEAVVAYDDDPVLARGSRRSVPRIAAAGPASAPLADTGEPTAAARAASGGVETTEASPAAADIVSARAASAEARPDRPDIAPGHRRRRILAYLAPLAVAAAALPFLWPGKQADGPLAFEYHIEHGSTRARGMAHVGDVLCLTSRSERHRAIWVYFEKHDLTAACPGSRQCRDADGELVLRVTLKEPGVYTVVSLDSADPIPPPAPGKTLDELLAAHSSGIHSERHTVEVD